ncbi:MAG: transcription initiation factor IIB [Halobacteriota archaeon]
MCVDSGHVCPECGGRIRTVNSETVCTECGLVVSENRIDRGPEWRSFPDDTENPERTGAPLTPSRHDRGLSTEIGRSRSISPRRRRRMARLRRHHRRARTASKRDRNRMYSFIEIRRHVSSLSLPDSVRDTACTVFQTAQDDDLLQGRSLEGFTAASVYSACRIASVSRTAEEVLANSTADENEFRAAFSAINRELDVPIGPPAPAEYLPRYASQLGVDSTIERRARELLSECTDRGLVNGRNPSGIAAACLYTAAVAADLNVTQRDAADVANVSPVTIRNTYRELSG